MERLERYSYLARKYSNYICKDEEYEEIANLLNNRALLDKKAYEISRLFLNSEEYKHLYYYHKGCYYFFIDDDKALNAFNEGLKSYAEYIPLLFQKGILLYYMGKEKESIRILQKLKSENMFHYEIIVYIYLALNYMELKKGKEVLRYAKEAVRIANLNGLQIGDSYYLLAVGEYLCTKKHNDSFKILLTEKFNIAFEWGLSYIDEDFANDY